MTDLSIQENSKGTIQRQTSSIYFIIKKHKIFLIAFLIHLFLLFWDVNEPWIGLHDFNGAFFGTLVKIAISNTDFNHLFSYWHHPPLFQILLFSFCQLFGTSEISFRIIPILFSLGNITLVYVILLKELDQQTANIAIIIFAFMPMTVYYGRMVAHESGTMFFILLTFFFYLKHIKQPSKKSLICIYSSFFLGTLIDWPGYFVFGIISLHVLFYQRNRKMVLKMGLLFLIGIISFYFTIAMYSTISQTGWELVLQQIVGKGGERSLLDIPLYEFIDLEYNRALRFFGILIVVLSFVYFCSEAYRVVMTIKQDMNKYKIRNIGQKIIENKPFILSLLFFMLGMTHILLFLQGARKHEYWMFYLSIGLIIPSAILINKQEKGIKYAFIVFYIVTSLFSLRTIHVTMDWPDLYELGLYIDERTDPDNYVFVPLPQVGYYCGCNYYLIEEGTNESAKVLSAALEWHQQEGNPIRYIVIAEWIHFKGEINTTLMNANFTLGMWGADFRIYSYSSNTSSFI